MNRTIIFFLFSTLLYVQAIGQVETNYSPGLQEKERIQYFTPYEEGWESGDPILFYHDGTFHVFYLLFSQENSHLTGRKNQWSHCSSKDLVHWQHHPIALPITRDWENAMATGSIIFERDTFFVFYTTFREDENGRNIQYISRSISTDGITFKKVEPNAFITPPGNYSVNNFRDPHVFFDSITRLYYMVITTEKTNEYLDHLKPSLAYFTSEDLLTWDFKGDMYLPGNADGFYYPECPTLFKWNDWYYLMYKQNGGTYYRISRSVTGPWMAPLEDNIGNDYALVHKVAEFDRNRRIAVGMVPSKKGNSDTGEWQWGGNMVFRELFQNEDGSLRSDVVKEMRSRYNETLSIAHIQIENNSGFSYKAYENIPTDGHISFDVIPGGVYEQIGVLLRYSEKRYYEVKFNKRKRQVTVGDQTITGVFGLDNRFSVDIYMDEDIIDLCIGGKRCILNRAYEQSGEGLILYVRNGTVDFENLSISEVSSE